MVLLALELRLLLRTLLPLDCEGKLPVSEVFAFCVETNAYARPFIL